jgi:hypothetical protein
VLKAVDFNFLTRSAPSSLALTTNSQGGEPRPNKSLALEKLRISNKRINHCQGLLGLKQDLQ